MHEQGWQPGRQQGRQQGRPTDSSGWTGNARGPAPANTSARLRSGLETKATAGGLAALQCASTSEPLPSGKPSAAARLYLPIDDELAHPARLGGNLLLQPRAGGRPKCCVGRPKNEVGCNFCGRQQAGAASQPAAASAPADAVHHAARGACLQGTRLLRLAQPLRLRAPGQRQPVLHSHLRGHQHGAAEHAPQQACTRGREAVRRGMQGPGKLSVGMVRDLLCAAAHTCCSLQTCAAVADGSCDAPSNQPFLGGLA